MLRLAAPCCLPCRRCGATTEHVRRAATSIALLLLVSGCVHLEATAGLTPEPERSADDSSPAIVRDVEVTYDDSEGESPEPTAAISPRRDRPPPDPVLFSLGAGHGALGRVDLGPCRQEGLPPGYVHLRVTFRRSGRVVRAAVSTPAEPPSEALACIGEQLEVALVPVFDGDDVTLSKSFFVN
jgi:hypothetical protein